MKPTILIAGNWKMHKTPSETKAFLAQLKEEIKQVKDGVRVAVFVPATSLCVAAEMLADSPILVGAQNCHYEEKGAFTGEISPLMLGDLGVHFAMVGHSERRSLFGEGGQMLNKKVKAVLSHGMEVVFCVGETLEQREAGKAQEVVSNQLVEGLAEVENLGSVTIAYEPVWAIGTGKTATSAQAQEMCAFIRGELGRQFGAQSEGVCIQYGGSMSEENAKELLACEDIDGGLIGSASLDCGRFQAIVESA